MFPKKLYVVGNGFDLWHGVLSRLSAFKQFVKAADQRVFDAVEEYLWTDDEWNDLESALARIDVGTLLDNLGHFMAPYGDADWSDSSHHDFQYEVQEVVKNLSQSLQQLFAQWIRQLKIPTVTASGTQLAGLESDAAFLNFNYTSTLTTLYSVPPERILHIHGCAALPNESLVLGHAWRPEDRKSLNDRPDIKDVDTRLVEANQILDRYFGTTFKPSSALIEQHQGFFSSLAQVSEVTVLGHSLSSVDAAYFHALLEQPGIVIADWRIACLCEDEWPEKQGLLKGLGVDTERATPMLWTSLLADRPQ